MFQFDGDDLKRTMPISPVPLSILGTILSSYFDLRMQNKAYIGRVYGDYNDPTVDLDTQKRRSLIKYEESLM